MCGPNPLLLKEKLGVGVPPQLYGAMPGGGVYGQCVSAFATHFDVNIFSVAQWIGVT